jgi:hypothetical protein
VPKFLPLKDFRARRRILTKDDFACPDDDVSPQDPIDQGTWEKLTTLPTDVAIQRSDHNGTRLKHLYDLRGLWLEEFDASRDGKTSENDMMLAPVLAAAEEFDAAIFDGLHGFYRQSIGCARNALELVVVGAACQTLKLHSRFEDWQNGREEFGFGKACDLLIGAETLRELKNRLAATLNDSLFAQKIGDTPGGWIRRLYAQLSDYSHSRPGFTHGDLWNSNGPVYDTKAFHLCFDSQIETFAACYLLTKIARPYLKIEPWAQNLLFKAHSGAWLNIAAQAAKELGLINE